MNDETSGPTATPGPASSTAPTAGPAGEWLAGFAEVIGAPAPEAEVVEALLDLAGAAAHDSERIAAPIACWMAGVAGVEPAEALKRARHYVETRAS